MKIKCPSCYAEHDWVAILNSEAEGELLALMSDLERAVSYPLHVYLSLFRSPTRALSPIRSLKLAQEVLSLESNHSRLSAGLFKTVEILREKQCSGNWKPMANHNYLKRVLEGLPGAAPAVHSPNHPSKPQTKTGEAMMALERLRHGQ